MSLALPIDPRDQLDFEPTQPPALADGVAFAFGPLGVEEVCASTVDTDSMAFESCWRITEKSGAIQAMPAQGRQGGFPVAMATIVHLNDMPAEQILTRKLDPCRWVFAWHIDDRRVAVAEAKYRVARNEQTNADGALMRLICDSGIRAGRFATAEAVNDDTATAKATDSADRADTPDGASRGAAAPAPAISRRGRTPFVRQPSHDRGLPERSPAARAHTGADLGAPRWSGRMLALAVSCVYVGMTALIALSHRDTLLLRAEAARLQATADATLRQRIDATFAPGNYAQLQLELDRLAALRHFSGAAVTNARGRTIAMAGEVRNVRMGDPIAKEIAASGRSLPLSSTGGGAQLLVWEPKIQAGDPLARNSTLILGLGVCTLATVAALFIARTQRRDAERLPAT